MEDVRLWEEIVVIPTYEVGEVEKNPIFLEKRVYQGSSGKVYPYPTIEKISNEKINKKYSAVYLENKYLKVMILPELGGRIHRAYDKTNDYDFVYYNNVIKPALVGLVGPWISGGIEFNWPQHHRPTTFMPVDYILQENLDGSKTVLVNDVDQMYGTKGIAAFTLYPDKAYIEVRGQLYNRTSMPQTFLWWANPAVPVNEYTQSIFPPDVHAVMDHGKRDVSKFPIADGVYYKHDYAPGTDISRYKNLPVPTSYMAEKSEYDFVGGYDYSKKAGLLHVADHHISPGKKQWTWGCGDFGKAWDRNLTDEDGPYIELMTGVYTDNQPDFTWLKPFEEKTFKQYFMPYKAVGAVKNATINAAINMEKRVDGIYVCVYATGKYENARIVIKDKKNIVWESNLIISPVDIFEEVLPIHVDLESDITVEVYDGDDILVEYQPKKISEEEMPEPAEAPKEPEDVETNEELYLTGLHIEQYHHATYLPDPYYLEGLKRDAYDIRINNAYGMLLMRRGDFKQAENHFRRALKRSTWKNPNPYNSEPYYNLGLVLFYTNKLEEAFDAFYKATWSSEQQEMSFYYLAVISTSRKEYEIALDFVDKALVKNSHNIKARGLKAYLLRKLNRIENAIFWVKENLDVDKFDYVSMFEKIQLQGDKKEINTNCMKKVMRDFHENYLQLARDYGEFGAYDEAIKVIELCGQDKPLLHYYSAYYLGKLGLDNKDTLKNAELACSDCCFPNKLEDINVLNYAIENNKHGAKAHYYLGNLYYDKLQYETAIKLWEKSVELDDKFSIAVRNLALANYNKRQNFENAKQLLEKAFLLDINDSRVFLELDQLYKKSGVTVKERLEKYEMYNFTSSENDALFIEYITLINLAREYKKAYELIMSRKFHPWEGGEGKITTQYKTCLIELARESMKNYKYIEAEDYLKKALIYPENLGEGKLEGTKDNNVYYYLGVVNEEVGAGDLAREYFEQATIGVVEPAGAMYYNDQPADMILYQGLAKEKLNQKKEAIEIYNKLIEYGKEHMKDNVKIEYFAVSLPDFLIFEENLNLRNQVHCNYLIGLGNMGLGNKEEATKAYERAITIDNTHMNALRYKKIIND
ncbi:MAG: DUF5107 domain-containing protein [Clostridiaceae bacterium]